MGEGGGGLVGCLFQKIPNDIIIIYVGVGHITSLVPNTNDSPWNNMLSPNIWYKIHQIYIFKKGGGL